MATPADKLRRGEYPEFSSGPLTGGNPIPPYGEGPKGVTSVKSTAPASTTSPKQQEVTIVSSKTGSAPAQKEVALTAPQSVALANVSGYAAQQTEFSIGQSKIGRENLQKGVVLGWHIGAFHKWDFHGPVVTPGNPTSPPGNLGIKVAYYPGSPPGPGIRTCGINLHERPKGYEVAEDRYFEVGILEDTEIRQITARDDDLLSYLPIKFGTQDAAGVFTPVVTIDATGISPIAPGSITPVTTDRLLGRDTAGSGPAEQIPVSGGIEFTGGPGIQTSAFTGDVTKAAGGTAQTIANDAVTNAKAADMAQSTIKGRASGAGTGDPTDLTVAQVLTILGLPPTDLVFTATPGDTAINSLSPVAVVTRDVAGLAAGDQLIIEGEFQILNDSGAARVYDFEIDVDADVGARITTASLANSATDLHWFHFRAVLSIFSTSEATVMTQLNGRGTAAQADGATDTMVGTYLGGRSFDTTANDRTGTQTVVMSIISSSATATQTCKLRSLTIRKVTPTP